MKKLYAKEETNLEASFEQLKQQDEAITNLCNDMQNQCQSDKFGLEVNMNKNHIFFGRKNDWKLFGIDIYQTSELSILRNMLLWFWGKKIIIINHTIIKWK